MTLNIERAILVLQVKQWLKDEHIALQYYGREYCATDLIVTYLISQAKKQENK